MVFSSKSADTQVGAEMHVELKAGDHIPRLFGRGCYALVERPENLSAALPRIYRQITTG